MMDKIHEWYSVLKKEEPSLLILPWKKERTAEPIRALKDIPTTITQLQWYFPRAQPPSQSTRNIMYTQAHIATSNVPDLVITKKKDSAMDWWYQENGGGVYIKPLPDAERPQVIGFMAYSGNFTDPTAAQYLINQALRDQSCSNLLAHASSHTQEHEMSENLRTNIAAREAPGSTNPLSPFR
jgi:hypothetical protein